MELKLEVHFLILEMLPPKERVESQIANYMLAECMVLTFLTSNCGRKTIIYRVYGQSVGSGLKQFHNLKLQNPLSLKTSYIRTISTMQKDRIGYQGIMNQFSLS